jgi:hypothetical protein
MEPSLWWWCVNVAGDVVSFLSICARYPVIFSKASRPALPPASQCRLARFPRSQGDGEGGHERAEEKWSTVGALNVGFHLARWPEARGGRRVGYVALCFCS